MKFKLEGLTVWVTPATHARNKWALRMACMHAREGDQRARAELRWRVCDVCWAHLATLLPSTPPQPCMPCTPPPALLTVALPLLLKPTCHSLLHVGG